MLGMFRKRYFQRIFLCYFLVILCLLAAFSGCMAILNQRRETEIQHANLETEAKMLAQVVDEKFNMLSETCIQLLNDTWIQKISSSSEIILASLDVYDRRAVCEMLRHHMNMSGIVSEMAILLPQKDEAIDVSSIWDSAKRYLQSVHILKEGFEEELYASVAESYGSMVLLPLENSQDIVAGRCLDVYAEQKQVFFFRISHSYFAGMLRNHMGSDAYEMDIVADGCTLLQMGAGMEDGETESFAIPSGLFGWSYRIVLPIVRGASFPVWVAAALEIALVLFALSMAAMISYFTYQPVMQMLRRLGILPSSGDEFSAIRRYFEEVRQSEIAAEGLTSQYYNSARNNLILSMLHGSFAKRITNDTLELFGVPFQQGDHCLYVVISVLSETEKCEEETARDLLRIQNYLVLEKIPAVKCVTPESELILILYEEDSEKKNASKCLSRYVLQLKKYCRDILAEYDCLSGLPHHGLLGISKSYQEALEARMDGEMGNDSVYYFPLDWEIQLITQLRAGNTKALERIFRELKRENQARSLKDAEHRQLIGMLTEILKRIARETNADLKDFQLRLSEAVEVEDREASWEKIAQLAWELCPAPEEGEGAQSIGECIRQHLHEHFRDCNLSQKGIAATFGLSCPNMSRMFKRVTGKNFIDYLHELRVTAAREAFDGGECDVLKVAQSCGYDNEVTFRRAFFRVYAISPHQYVRQLKENR